VHLAQFFAGFVHFPAQRGGNLRQMRLGVIAHLAIAFQQAVHQSFDPIGMRGGEALVDHQNVSDHQQIAVTDQDLGAAIGRLDYFVGPTTSSVRGDQPTQPLRRGVRCDSSCS